MASVVRTDSDDPDFRLLIKELDNDLNNRYGKKQADYNGYNKIDFIATVVIVYEDEKSVGCGCFKQLEEDSVEIKRMYLRPEYRGTGISMLIIKELQSWAKEDGYAKTVLETGKGQPEAIRFYTKSGYHIVPNYGQYVGMDNSICMSKNIEL